MSSRILTSLFGASAAMALAAASWTGVADHLVRTPVESYPFNWGEGVQMMGLLAASRGSQDPRYADYVEKWARIYEAQDIRKLLDIDPASGNPKRRG